MFLFLLFFEYLEFVINEPRLVHDASFFSPACKQEWLSSSCVLLISQQNLSLFCDPRRLHSATSFVSAINATIQQLSFTSQFLQELADVASVCLATASTTFPSPRKGNFLLPF